MRRSVKTTYQRAGSTPSKRHRRSQELGRGISGEAVEGGSKLSPLARYIAENEGSGLPVSELVQQFREFDCEHQSQEPIARVGMKTMYRCLDCGLSITVDRSIK